ncbi:MAG TPA: 4a-hydroxytetrahydrobiopterin dehydratase [Actinomycetota bacterium]|nr:4a-hydroxytetrahydrobiopterin dehydratase [Actinomycetota bacterium]
MELSAQRCEVCRPGMQHISDEEALELMPEIDPAWELVGGHERIRREVATGDFAAAMALAVHVGFLAEAEGHHPDLHVRYGRLVIEVWTHHAHGLTRNDFILAAKIDRLIAS